MSMRLQAVALTAPIGKSQLLANFGARWLLPETNDARAQSFRGGRRGDSQPIALLRLVLASCSAT